MFQFDPSNIKLLISFLPALKPRPFGIYVYAVDSIVNQCYAYSDTRSYVPVLIHVFIQCETSAG